MLSIKDITDKHKEILYSKSLIQYKNISSIKINNGHQVFKMNIDTLLITLANYKIDIIKENGKEYKKYSLSYESGHIYIPALRLESAAKKASKLLYIIDAIVKKETETTNNQT